MSKDNQHLLILDGHDSYATIDVRRQACLLGLDLVILLLHTSQILQPLDIVCSKAFKSVFRHHCGIQLLAHMGARAHKEDSAHCIISTALKRENITLDVKGSSIWHVHETKFDNKMAPSKYWPQHASCSTNVPVLVSMSKVSIEVQTLGVLIPQEWLTANHYYVDIVGEDMETPIDDSPNSDKEVISSIPIENAQVIPGFCV